MTQHRAVLIIFPLILQTSTRAQMLSIGGEGDSFYGRPCPKWPVVFGVGWWSVWREL